VTKAEIAARRARALQLRQAGATYSQIGQQLGVSESRACRIVQDGLDQAIRESAPQVRRLELARLDQLWVEALKVLRRKHTMVSNGQVVRLHKDGEPLEDDGPVLNAIHTLLRIQERRARLLGLDAPAQARVTVLSEDAVDAEIRRLSDELAQLDAAQETPAAPPAPG
jgi:predicted transcriptional regulator